METQLKDETGKPVTITKYSKVSGSRIRSSDAQEIGEILFEISQGPIEHIEYNKNYKDAIIERAFDPDSVLHKYFTWEDDLAAQKCRRTEAAYIVRMMEAEVVHFRVEKIDGEDEEIEIKTKVKMMDAIPSGDNSFVYKTAFAVLENTDLQNSQFAKLYTYLLGAVHKFNRYSELAEDLTGLEDIIVSLGIKTGKSETKIRNNIQRVRKGL